MPHPCARSRNRTPPPLRLDCLLRVRIVNQQLALLVKPVRQVLRNLNNIERICRLVEDLVHLLETSVRGLGKEKVNGGYHGSVDDGENNVSLVANRGEGDGRDHDDHEIEGPVGSLFEWSIYVSHTILTSKLTVEIAFAGARMLRGVISAGYNQVMPSQPIAKKELKTKRKTV
jgi:hypothetical protein